MGWFGGQVFALSRVTWSTLLAVRPREKVIEVGFKSFFCRKQHNSICRASISSAGELSRLHRHGNFNGQEISAILPCHVGPVHF